MFLRNEWYVAGFSRELDGKPLQRWLLGEPLVLYRTASGQAVILEDRCPHRGAPISAGEVCGEAIACGYHGFTFDPSGACIHIPGMRAIPPQARVRAYPTLERWGWVFVWMGEPAQADPARLPDYHWLVEPGWEGRSEYLSVKAHYGLVRDNLLDLTHARYVHRKTLGTAAVTEFPVSTEAHGRGVRVTRHMPDIEPSPFFKRMGGFTGRVDHRQQIDFVPPCHVVINTRVSSVPGRGENRSAEFHVLNALTPENEHSTHYFWGLVRNFALGDDAVTEMQQTLNRETFFEDLAILEQQQVLLQCKPEGWQPVATRNDGGCIQAERLMSRLLDAETSSRNEP
jgi:vanillate O-demethylase monooxygenase subunit